MKRYFLLKRLLFFSALTTWHAAWLYAAPQLATHASFFMHTCGRFLSFLEPPRLFAGKFHNNRKICNWHVVANLRANSTITENNVIDMLWRVLSTLSQTWENLVSFPQKKRINGAGAPIDGLLLSLSSYHLLLVYCVSLLFVWALNVLVYEALSYYCMRP